MNKEKNKRGNKYAFNINDINSNKKFKGSLLDFKSLNRGTYDEIEIDDMKIRDNIGKLKDVKNKTIKELVYTNKDIPVQWKNKLEYKPNLLKIFLNDSNFLRYLGNGGSPIKIKYKNNKEKQKENFKTNEIKKINIIKNKSEKKEQEKKIIAPSRTISNKNMSKYGRFKEKHNYLDKEIIGILDDFKSAYPILIKEKEKSEIYINKNIRKNEDKKSQTFYDNNTHYNKKRYINIALPNLKLKSNNRRLNTFRQNIFTNLLPSNQSYTTQQIEGNKTYTNFNVLKNKKDLYLNSYNDFEKKININNPIIMKYLEGINFYGPYFSYCPPCGNKNLEFYKNLEQKQCLQIIHQIKKNKGKNVIVNEDKNNKKIKEKKESIKNIADNYDSESYNYNIKSVKNNYSESMIQQFSSNSSKKGYTKEKYEIIH